MVAGFLVHSANKWPGSSSDSHKQEFFFSHEISDLSVSTLFPLLPSFFPFINPYSSLSLEISDFQILNCGYTFIE